MREIVLDTESTGLDPADGHRLIEIACVELKNHLPTGATYQAYLNPERDVPIEALRVHGLTQEFLSSHPRFSEIAEAFLEFVGEDPLVIHNAEFDMRFLNAELARCARPQLAAGRARDTLLMARRKYPGAPASLDALCRRFGISLSDRALHGGLVDARLLADVYLELIGGRQPSLILAEGTEAAAAAQAVAHSYDRTPRPSVPSDAELTRHRAMLAKLPATLWRE